MKKGVVEAGVQPQTWFALGTCFLIYHRHGAVLRITSLTDGVHPDAKNIHGRGFAADLGIRDWPTLEPLAATTVQSLFLEIRAALDPLGFDVVLEADHIHVEFDPKPGEGCFEEGVA